MDKKYPIGRPTFVETATAEQIKNWIAELATLPQQIQEAVEGFSDEVLDQSYREGGWNAKQIIHHLTHSHMHALMRVELALTENNPTVPSYSPDALVKLEDRFGTPMELSLYLLEEIQTKLVLMFNSITGDEWQRTFANDKAVESTILKTLIIYAWHGKHHLAHIKLITEN